MNKSKEIQARINNIFNIEITEKTTEISKRDLDFLISIDSAHKKDIEKLEYNGTEIISYSTLNIIDQHKSKPMQKIDSKVELKPITRTKVYHAIVNDPSDVNSIPKTYKDRQSAIDAVKELIDKN